MLQAFTIFVVKEVSYPFYIILRWFLERPCCVLAGSFRGSKIGFQPLHFSLTHIALQRGPVVPPTPYQLGTLVARMHTGLISP